MHPTGLVFIWIWEGLLVVSGRGGSELRSPPPPTSPPHPNFFHPFVPATLAPSVPPQPPWLVHSSPVSAFVNLNPRTSYHRPSQRRPTVHVHDCVFECMCASLAEINNCFSWGVQSLSAPFLPKSLRWVNISFKVTPVSKRTFQAPFLPLIHLLVFARLLALSFWPIRGKVQKAQGLVRWWALPTVPNLRRWRCLVGF